MAEEKEAPPPPGIVHETTPPTPGFSMHVPASTYGPKAEPEEPVAEPKAAKEVEEDKNAKAKSSK